MIRALRAAPFWCVLLAAAACVNVIAGLVIAVRDPARAADLLTMYAWCRAWLVGGQSLYTVADASTDYPPNAIVMLSPIVLVPPRWLVPMWAIAAVLLTPVLAWLVFRAASGRQRRSRVLLVPILLFL